jgi:hypothetical protein
VAVKALIITCATLMIAAPAVSAAETRSSGKESFHVNAYLCQTAEYAIKFAAVASRVDQEEEASAIVGKAFNGEVCGKYIGFASVEKREIIVEDGIPYILLALRFKEDNRLAWTAEPDVTAIEPPGAPKEPSSGTPKNP